MDSLFTYWYVFPIAMGICITVCTVGIEGSILFVPFFALGFPLLSGQKLEPVEAIKIGLFTEIFGFTSSFFGFWRAKLIDYRISIFSIAVGVPLAVAGGLMTYVLPPQGLLLVVCASLPILSYLIYLGPSQVELEASIKEVAQPEPSLPVANPAKDDSRRFLVDKLGRRYAYHYRNDLRRIFAAGVGGLFEGLVGFGIGATGITDLVLRGIPVRVAIGTSHMVIMIVAFAAVAPHIYKALAGGSIPWQIIAMTIPAVLIGGQIAPKVTGLLPQPVLKRALATILLIFCLITAYRIFAMSNA